MRDRRSRRGWIGAALLAVAGVAILLLLGVGALASTRGRRPWGRAALWLDSGRDDPFRRSDHVFAGALGITLRLWPGGHEGAYWRRHYREYLRFYAGALARCSPSR